MRINIGVVGLEPNEPGACCERLDEAFGRVRGPVRPLRMRAPSKRWAAKTVGPPKRWTVGLASGDRVQVQVTGSHIQPWKHTFFSLALVDGSVHGNPGGAAVSTGVWLGRNGLDKMIRFRMFLWCNPVNMSRGWGTGPNVSVRVVGGRCGPCEGWISIRSNKADNKGRSCQSAEWCRFSRMVKPGAKWKFAAGFGHAVIPSTGFRSWSSTTEVAWPTCRS